MVYVTELHTWWDSSSFLGSPTIRLELVITTESLKDFGYSFNKLQTLDQDLHRKSCLFVLLKQECLQIRLI